MEGGNHFITILDELPTSITMIEEYAVRKNGEGRQVWTTQPGVVGKIQVKARLEWVIGSTGVGVNVCTAWLL